ncbi:MAG: type II toxin-antitoxin system RelE/ParE family toxin [Gemmatimonadota bacterium]|nr:type II toxin-antitoxin system RelE/ParE family toxin [Gemmatimonadota bacterium]
MNGATLKPVQWVGSSRADLKRFPDPVRERMGYAIYQAQAGFRHRDVKPLKGFGSAVLEVVARHDGDTFRAVYTIRFEAAVYVLHAFQKKAKRGITTSKKELDVVRHRLKVAEQHYWDTYGEG